MRALAFMLLVVLLGSAHGHRGATDAVSSTASVGDTSFDFFLLVRQWPGTFCHEHSCPLLKHPDDFRFTLHGLWPNRNDGSWPQFCDTTQPFDEDLVDDLRSEMDHDWPSFMDDSTSENFWAHEWNKHGTCALKEMKGEHAFFKTVLDLNHKYSLEAALGAAGITPSSKTRYSKAAVLSAIQEAYGVNALVHCSPQGQLTEVWMCIDKALQPMECHAPPAEAAHCHEVSLPPMSGIQEVTLGGTLDTEADLQRMAPSRRHPLTATGMLAVAAGGLLASLLTITVLAVWLTAMLPRAAIARAIEGQQIDYARLPGAPDGLGAASAADADKEHCIVVEPAAQGFQVAQALLP